MTTLDPIIAVKNVEASSQWYERVFLFSKAHGGQNFSVLVSNENKIILCLHKWEDEHPTMTNPNIPAGNGLILYFRTDNVDEIYQNAIKAGCVIEQDVHLNSNSLKQEFSFRDPDGYFLTVTEFHSYEG
jgi:uncharacterized glyoxalase superfamily protein PhnB